MAKETTKKQAEATAAAVKSQKDCAEAVMQEALDLADGKQHSVQKLMAYAKQWRKLGK